MKINSLQTPTSQVIIYCFCPSAAFRCAPDAHRPLSIEDRSLQELCLIYFVVDLFSLGPYYRWLYTALFHKPSNAQPRVRKPHLSCYHRILRDLRCSCYSSSTPPVGCPQTASRFCSRTFSIAHTTWHWMHVVLETPAQSDANASSAMEPCEYFHWISIVKDDIWASERHLIVQRIAQGQGDVSSAVVIHRCNPCPMCMYSRKRLIYHTRFAKRLSNISPNKCRALADVDSCKSDISSTVATRKALRRLTMYNGAEWRW